MSDRRDEFERRLADDIGALADTPLPGRSTPETVAEAALAADRRTRWRTPLLAGAAAVATVVTAIALSGGPTTPVPDPVGRSSTSPTDEPPTLTEAQYRCGGGYAFSPSLLTEPDLDLASTAPGEALAAFIEAGRDHGLLPDGGWHLAGMDDSSASFVAESHGVPSAAALLEHSNNEWRVVSWGGGCTPQLDVSGMNSASWTLVARQDITPATTTFLADVTERDCVGGASSEDRVQPPLISYGPDRVVVAFVVQPPPGDGLGDCIGNPSTRVRVQLDEPLRGRALLDGGTLPWEDRIATAPDGEFWWGPLTVADWAGGDAALLTGTLRIGETCVTVLTGGGDEVLLVWPTDRTAWHRDDHTIRFVNPDGHSVDVADGDEVRFGGSGGSTEESGVPGEQWRDSTEWYRPPSDSCPLDAWWGVGEILDER